MQQFNILSSSSDDVDEDKEKDFDFVFVFEELQFWMISLLLWLLDFGNTFSFLVEVLFVLSVLSFLSFLNFVDGFVLFWSALACWSPSEYDNSLISCKGDLFLGCFSPERFLRRFNGEIREEEPSPTLKPSLGSNRLSSRLSWSLFVFGDLLLMVDPEEFLDRSLLLSIEWSSFSISSFFPFFTIVFLLLLFFYNYFSTDTIVLLLFLLLCLFLWCYFCWYCCYFLFVIG